MEAAQDAKGEERPQVTLELPQTVQTVLWLF